MKLNTRLTKAGDDDRKYDAGHAESCDQKDQRERGKSGSFSDLNDRDVLSCPVNVENGAEHAPDAAHQERDRH